MKSGIVIINKPTGCTSRFIVDKLGKYYQTKKIGHAGTLDPLATGVLIILVNKATKLERYLMSEDKEYLVEMELGKKSDTLDITGEVSEVPYKLEDEDLVKSKINSFIKSYDQEVPLYSAVKVNGRKCYEYARAKQKVKLPIKSVTIKAIENIVILPPKISFRVTVSKGTYIRSLVRDIGNLLGTEAIVTKLERRRQGLYSINEAITIDDELSLISIDKIFAKTPKIEVDDLTYYRVKNANTIENEKNLDYACIYYQEKLIAIYQRHQGILMKPLIIL